MKDEKIKIVCQYVIDSELESIVKESEEWGLGEMEELRIINSIDKIVVDRVTSQTRVTIYVDIYSNSKEEDEIEYDDFMSELRYRIETKWIPNSFIQLESIFFVD